MRLGVVGASLWALLVQYVAVHVGLVVCAVEAVSALLCGARVARPRERVVITGASSGLGASLALRYARAGASLALSGRNKERMEQVADACRAKGARVDVGLVDVADRGAMRAWLERVDKAWGGVDLVIANAGIQEDMVPGGTDDSVSVLRQVLDTNVMGVVHTLEPLLPGMRERRSGQVVLIASLAGFMGLTGSSAYSASKAAMRSLAEGLRADLARDNVAVNVICPGFVRSAITDALAAKAMPMPFFMETEPAVDLMVQGIDDDVPEIAFPSLFYGVIAGIAALPRNIRDFFARNRIIPAVAYRRPKKPAA